jgi:microcystin-dependent protein
MRNSKRLIIFLLILIFSYLIVRNYDIEPFFAVPNETNLKNVAFTNDNGDIFSVEKSAVFTKGMIVAFTGRTAPKGWALCNGDTVKAIDGSNLITPDLRGRFILGATFGDVPDDNDRGGRKLDINDKGGERKHKLTIKELAKHSHRVYRTSDRDGGQYPKNSIKNLMITDRPSVYTDNSDDNVPFIENSGEDEPHNNMPPYYVLAFIIKL